MDYSQKDLPTVAGTHLGPSLHQQLPALTERNNPKVKENESKNLYVTVQSQDLLVASPLSSAHRKDGFENRVDTILLKRQDNSSMMLTDSRSPNSMFKNGADRVVNY